MSFTEVLHHRPVKHEQMHVCHSEQNTNYNNYKDTYGFMATGGMHLARASMNVFIALSGWSRWITCTPDIMNGTISLTID